MIVWQWGKKILTGLSKQALRGKWLNRTRHFPDCHAKVMLHFITLISPICVMPSVDVLLHHLLYWPVWLSHVLLGVFAHSFVQNTVGRLRLDTFLALPLRAWFQLSTSAELSFRLGPPCFRGESLRFLEQKCYSIIPEETLIITSDRYSAPLHCVGLRGFSGGMQCWLWTVQFNTRHSTEGAFRKHDLSAGPPTPPKIQTFSFH